MARLSATTGERCVPGSPLGAEPPPVPVAFTLHQTGAERRHADVGLHLEGGDVELGFVTGVEHLPQRRVGDRVEVDLAGERASPRPRAVWSAWASRSMTSHNACSMASRMWFPEASPFEVARNVNVRLDDPHGVHADHLERDPDLLLLQEVPPAEPAALFLRPDPCAANDRQPVEVDDRALRADGRVRGVEARVLDALGVPELDRLHHR